MHKLFFSILLFITFNCLKGQIPTITSFLPLSGKPGDVLTLVGNNFNSTASNNVVFFGAVKATVTAATVNSLTVTVPVGATYAPISVINIGNSLIAYSLQNFTPTFSPVKTNITTSDFSPPTNFGAIANPSSIAIGDLDGDGKPDLVVANTNASTVSVYRNTATSGSINSNSFDAKVDFTTGIDTWSVVISDLDGDGKPELIAANGSQGLVYVFRNTATSGSINSGSFANKVSFEAGGPRSIAIGDVDGDGKPDMVTGNPNNTSVSVFRNTAISGSINSGSFAARVNFAGGGSSVALGDIDGDGKLDIVTTNTFYSTLSVLRNTGSIGSIGSSSFAAKVDFAAGPGPGLVVIGDLDGDGKPDLVTANPSSSNISVLRNIATSGSINSGSLATHVDYISNGGGIESVAIGDLNGDGKPDLATANRNNNRVLVLRNTSTSGSINSSTFANQVNFATGQQPQTVIIGDLDGDSKPDLITTNYSVNGSTVSVLRNTDIVVPTTITSFKAFTKNSGIQVDWNTQNETNFDRYEVEKSTNGFNFNKAGTVIATGLSAYNWLDANPKTGSNYYRLKMIDKDGSFKYSSIVNVKIGGIKNVFTVAGNPIKNGQLVIQMENVEKGNYTITIYNNLGQQMINKTIVHETGSATQTIELGNVAAGTYQLSIIGSNVKTTRTIVVE